MSTDNSEILNLLINTGAPSVQCARYVTVVSYAVQVYDWLICLNDEVRYVHKSRWTSIKIAYLICRYFPLFVFPFYIWGWVGNHPISVCAKVVQPLHILLCLFPFFAQAVFIIRTYAFTGSRKRVLAFLVAFWMALLGFYLYVHSTQWSVALNLQEFIGDTACFGTDVPQEGEEIDWKQCKWDASFMLCLFLFDCIMTGMVFAHAIRSQGMFGPLGKLFVAQGLIAFVVLSVMNLATAIIGFTSDQRWHGLSILSGQLSNIVACRLILMLRRGTDPTATTQLGNDTKLLRDEIRRMEVVGIGELKSDHDQSIESWD